MAPVNVGRGKSKKTQLKGGGKRLIRNRTVKSDATKLKSPRSKMIGNKKQKLSTGAKMDKKRGTGVVYLAHIPHGFYEHEIKAFFSQFGQVLAVKVARSTKTGRHLDYAYIKFGEECVAEIAAETMNNYLMFGKLLKCEVVPKSKQTRSMFVNDLDKFKEKVLAKQAIPVSREQDIKSLQTTKKTITKIEKQLASLGIKFTFSFESSDHKESLLEESSSTAAPSDEVTNAECSSIDDDDDEITFKLSKTDT